MNIELLLEEKYTGSPGVRSRIDRFSKQGPSHKQLVREAMHGVHQLVGFPKNSPKHF